MLDSDIARRHHLDGAKRLSLSAQGFGARGPKWIQDFLDYPNLGRLEAIDLAHNQLTDDAIGVLARHPRVGPDLHTLDLRGNRIGPAGALELATAPGLTGLRVLDLDENPLGDDGLGFLAESASLCGVTDLRIGKIGAQAPGFAALAASPTFRGVELLSICGSRAGSPTPAAIDAFVRALTWTSLREVALCFFPLAPSNVAAMLASPAFAAVTKLKLVDASIGPGLGAVLAAAPVTALRQLDVAANVLGDAGAATLIGAPLLERLETLNLEGNDIRDAACAALLDAAPRALDLRLFTAGRTSKPNWRGPLSLAAEVRRKEATTGVVDEVFVGTREMLDALLASGRTTNVVSLRIKRVPLTAGDLGRIFASPWNALAVLGLEACQLDAASLAALPSPSALPAIRALALSENPLGPDGARALAQQPLVGALERLEVGWCDVGDAGAHALLASTGMQRLRHLDLRRNGITHDGALALVDCPVVAQLASLQLGGNELTDEETWHDWNGAHVGGAPACIALVRLREKTSGSVTV